MTDLQRIEEPEDYADLVRLIGPLSEPQKKALSRICIGDDSCLNPKVSKSLHRLSLIDYGIVDMGGGFRMYRAEVHSIRVHMAWCEWCSVVEPEACDLADGIEAIGG